MMEPMRKNDLNSPPSPESGKSVRETTSITSHPTMIAQPIHMGMLILEYVLPSSSSSALAIVLFCFLVDIDGILFYHISIVVKRSGGLTVRNNERGRGTPPRLGRWQQQLLQSRRRPREFSSGVDGSMFKGGLQSRSQKEGQCARFRVETVEVGRLTALFGTQRSKI